MVYVVFIWRSLFDRYRGGEIGTDISVTMEISDKTDDWIWLVTTNRWISRLSQSSLEKNRIARGSSIIWLWNQPLSIVEVKQPKWATSALRKPRLNGSSVSYSQRCVPFQRSGQTENPPAWPPLRSKPLARQQHRGNITRARARWCDGEANANEANRARKPNTIA